MKDEKADLYSREALLGLLPGSLCGVAVDSHGNVTLAGTPEHLRMLGQRMIDEAERGFVLMVRDVTAVEDKLYRIVGVLSLNDEQLAELQE